MQKPYVLAVLIALAIACGNSSSTTTPSSTPTPAPSQAPAPTPSVAACPAGTTNHGTVSATIDGTPWTSGCVFLVSYGGSGSVLFKAQNTDASSTIQIAAGIPQSGSGAAITPGVLFQMGTSIWRVDVNGGTGTMTITSSSATAIAGTFSFNSVPLAGTTATKTITAGSFSITA